MQWQPYDTTEAQPTDASSQDAAALADLVQNFPAYFDTVVGDWGKFKAGLQANLFTKDDAAQVIDWYQNFGSFWQTIRPNFLTSNDTANIVSIVFSDSTPFTDKVDNWVNKLGSEIAQAQVIVGGLGFPLLIVAGILVLALFGAGTVLWAIAYWRKQANVSSIIDKVTAGQLPASVLQTAVAQEQSSIVSDFGGVLKWAAIGLGLYLALPIVKDLVGGRKK